MFIVTILVWIILSLCVAAYAENKGRSAAVLLLVSLVLSPLIGFCIAVAMSPNVKNIERDQLQGGSVIRCPYCAEIIRKEAVICKHCGKDVIQESESPKTNLTFTMDSCPKCKGRDLYKVIKNGIMIQYCSKCKESIPDLIDALNRDQNVFYSL